MMTFAEWSDHNYYELNTQFSESGADHELDFDREQEEEEMYEAYCIKQSESTKRWLFNRGRWWAEVPPFCHHGWDTNAWIAWIDSHGKWKPIKEEDLI